jgi:hypothetical protein
LATYRIYSKCEYCDDKHPLPFGFSMDRKVPEERSISEIFKEKRLPKSIISIIQNRLECPNTGNELQQSDPNKLFIVPTGII